MPETATYVYCVVHRTRRPAASRVPRGVPGGGPVQLGRISPALWLVHAGVPLDEYAAERIQARLQDLDWVSEIAVAHEAVVERFVRVTGATVVPMKLFTLFSSPARAVAEMASRRRQLDSVVRRIRGTAEWGVRIARRAQPQPAAAGRPESGTAFLAAKKQVRDEARRHSIEAAGAAEQTMSTLDRIAKASRRQPVPPEASSPPLLDAAFLVTSTKTHRFKQAVRHAAERCRAVGAELTLTGPWPAYNFVAAEDQSR
jgi:hypothetical protein